MYSRGSVTALRRPIYFQACGVCTVREKLFYLTVEVRDKSEMFSLLFGLVLLSALPPSGEIYIAAYVRLYWNRLPAA